MKRAAFGALLLTGCSGGGGAVASLPAPAPTIAPQYVALGDSMTYGYGTTNPATKSFPAQLATLRSWPVIDLGIDGENAFDMLQNEVPNVPANATIVTVWIGVNDVNAMMTGQPISEVVAQVSQAIADVQTSAPGAKIVIMTPVDVSLLASDSNAYPPTPALRSLAHSVTLAYDAALRKLGPKVCDIGEDPAYYADPGHFYAADHYHPSDSGAAFIASFVDTCEATP